MKKVFAVLAIAGFMASCNNSGEKKEGATDSTTKMSADTSMNKMNTDTSMSKMKSDSGMSKMSADTTKK